MEVFLDSPRVHGEKVRELRTSAFSPGIESLGRRQEASIGSSLGRELAVRSGGEPGAAEAAGLAVDGGRPLRTACVCPGGSGLTQPLLVAACFQNRWGRVGWYRRLL